MKLKKEDIMIIIIGVIILLIVAISTIVYINSNKDKKMIQPNTNTTTTETNNIITTSIPETTNIIENVETTTTTVPTTKEVTTIKNSTNTTKVNIQTTTQPTTMPTTIRTTIQIPTIDVITKDENGNTILRFQSTFKFSSLTPNTKYIVNLENEVYPLFTNDTGKNYILYTRTSLNGNYEDELYTAKKITSGSISFGYGGSIYNFYIKEATIAEILEKYSSDIHKLSESTKGQLIDMGFNDYIYNDTSEVVTIKTKDKAFNQVLEDSIVINPGEIIECSWMIDEILYV